MKKIPSKFIFMKVGNHANETFDDILMRKQKEFDKTGMIFWGYGGNTCHPTKHVQPFVEHFKKNGPLYLVMQSVLSKADPDILPATEYSADGIHWEPIPEGIHVTGSRYAMILGELHPGELDFPTNGYRVAVGNSEGKLAKDYLQGRIDKGCIIRDESFDKNDTSLVKKIDYFAELKPPYSVFLKPPKF